MTSDPREEVNRIRSWAIIPARGGSKGIPRKNLMSVGGVPLLARSIRACLAATSVSRTIVSTDDDEIAALAEKEGASVVRRPMNLATDSASSEGVVRHAIEASVGSGADAPHFSLLVQCTSPFTTASDLDAIIEKLASGEFDSCFTAAPNHRFLWRRDQEGHAIAVNHDASVRLPRQSLDPEFVETGAAYGFTTSGFLDSRHRFFGRVGMVEIDPGRAMEIDDPQDLTLARALESADRSGTALAGSRPLPESVRALVMDFDGVLTDDKVTTNQFGHESVVASRRDGLGLSRLRSSTSLALLVLSTETNGVVQRRCEKLQLECLSSVKDKGSVLRSWLEERDISPSECVYVGNDVNDLPAMETVGFSAAPCDAQESVLDQVDLVLTKPGGGGAVREIAELLLRHPGTAGIDSTVP